MAMFSLPDDSNWRFVPKVLVNGLTASRGFSGPVVAGLLLTPGYNRIAFWWFLVAILTDLIDGRLARYIQPNPIGHWLDPAADKLLTNPTWLALWWIGWAPIWLVAGCLFRDLFAGWLWWRGVATVSPAAQVGIAYEGVALCVLAFHGPWRGVHWPSVGMVLGAVALALFVASLPHYWTQSRL